ncbi:MAG: VanW family protein [Candidatus Paceibacterota bacterium]|jgi:vancomycin resistance protein YoaR
MAHHHKKHKIHHARKNVTHIKIRSTKTPAEIEYATKPPKIKPKIKWLILGTIIALVASLGLMFEYSYSNSFYPGVSIGGIAVGGKNFNEVLTLFQGQASVLEHNGLEISLSAEKGILEVNIPTSATGLTPDKIVEYFSLGDWRTTIFQAYQFGRTGSVLERAKDQLTLLFKMKKFALPATVRDEALWSLISRESKDFLKETTPANFSITKTGKVTITPEKIGEVIDRKRLITAIQKNLDSFNVSPIYFEVGVKIPNATEAKLQQFLKFAGEVAEAHNLILEFNGYKWKVRNTVLATWLTLDNKNQISIDDKKIESFLEKNVLPVVDNPPRNSRFAMENGILSETSPGKSGNVVDMEKITANINQAILLPQKNDVHIYVETIHVEPKITQKTIDDYMIHDLVGSAKTSFVGSSSDRRHNIEVGVSKLNGMLIAPGEEFSAVLGIGPVTEELGFVKESVIKDHKTVKELGGGLCQIATTLFRMALNAGLPITERTNHSYVVSYYGPGLDATIYGPHPDFRFVNDTDHYLLLQGRVSGSTVTLELYGQKDGRKATISDPILSDHIPAPDTKYELSPDLPLNTQKCSETPHDGLTAEASYRIDYPNGTVREQIFKSVYKPWYRTCLVGTKVTSY